MDGTVLQLGLFLGATFAASLIAGLAGFAFALIAAAVWLHILTPLQTVSLIVGYGLIVQGSGMWKLRHMLNWSRLWPFFLGGVPGVVLGIAILGWVNPAAVRAAVSAVLVLYALYSLARPTLKPVQAGAISDGCVGFLNGLLGGVTGISGIVVVIWSGLRGWPKDVQRAVFQPVIVATFVMSAIGLGATGAITADTLILFLIGLPALLAGTWLGLSLYGHLDEAGFRRVVLLLLLGSGLLLIAGIR
jgi:uncharacterized membrane protein YfcA